MKTFQEWIEAKKIEKLNESWVNLANEFGINWSAVANSNYAKIFGGILAKLSNPDSHDWIDDVFNNLEVSDVEKNELRGKIVNRVRDALSKQKPGIGSWLGGLVGMGNEKVVDNIIGPILNKLQQSAEGMRKGGLSMAHPKFINF